MKYEKLLDVRLRGRPYAECVSNFLLQYRGDKKLSVKRY